MKCKQSRKWILVGSLGLLLWGASCSLDSTALSQNRPANTYVRAHRGPTVFVASENRNSPLLQDFWASNLQPVKVSKNRNFTDLAPAFGSRYAAVPTRRVVSPLASISKRITSSKRKPALAARGQLISQVRTTAYTHGEADHLRYGSKNAIGTRLQYGAVRSAAADWSRYPLGTMFRIVGQPGVTYVVDDYGGALVGTGTIDLYKPSFAGMNRWGVRRVDIEVVKWGSFEESLRVLRPRGHWNHVRRMVNSIAYYNSNKRSPADVNRQPRRDYARFAVLPLDRG